MEKMKFSWEDEQTIDKVGTRTKEYIMNAFATIDDEDRKAKLSQIGRVRTRCHVPM